MCGIAGFYNPNENEKKFVFNVASEMSKSISHRGPDGKGIWAGVDCKLMLVHQRLAVVDTSEAGCQPMTSSRGRFVIVFNGEIYNYKAIRQSLTRSHWRGDSDTEVLLEAIEEWGLEEAVRQCDGMFAFAVYDQSLKIISLVRDRMGEKPLFYGWSNGVFIFGSELKALKSHPCFHSVVNMEAVSLYFRHGYIPAPSSIYEGVYKLLPAHILSISLTPSTYEIVDVQRYWTLSKTADLLASGDRSPSHYLDELEKSLTRAVVQESNADVPLGSFLSGGIDSSLITALLQKHSDKKIETFTLGFDEKKYDESVYAKSVAKSIGTVHNELVVSPHDLNDIIPNLSCMFDEPFGDPSAIPTYVVSKLARSSVTVALTGDGGDEIFGGYNHYQRANQIWSTVKKIPAGARGLATLMLSPVGKQMYETSLGRKAEKLSNYLSCQSLFDCYRFQTQSSDFELLSVLKSPTEVSRFQNLSLRSDSDAMMFADMHTYLPDDILVKVDRAGMSVSLETRAPFLDHHVVELGYNLPPEFKIAGSNNKVILRDLLARYIPRDIFERPKMGFGLPIDEWLRGSLRDWAEDLLSVDSLKKVGFLNVVFIRRRWDEHISGDRDWHYFLWDLLMFLDWFQGETSCRK